MYCTRRRLERPLADRDAGAFSIICIALRPPGAEQGNPGTRELDCHRYGRDNARERDYDRPGYPKKKQGDPRQPRRKHG
jgi:hypothetical protein